MRGFRSNGSGRENNGRENRPRFNFSQRVQAVTAMSGSRPEVGFYLQCRPNEAVKIDDIGKYVDAVEAYARKHYETPISNIFGENRTVGDYYDYQPRISELENKVPPQPAGGNVSVAMEGWKQNVKQVFQDQNQHDNVDKRNLFNVIHTIYFQYIKTGRAACPPPICGAPPPATLVIFYFIYTY